MTAPRVMPADFALLRVSMSQEAVAVQLRVSRDTVRAWDATLSPADKALMATAAKERHANGLKRHHAARAAKPKAPKKQPHFRTHVPGTMLDPVPPGGPIADAIMHLRRKGFVPVYDKGRVHGKVWSGLYAAGRWELDAAGLLDLAAKNGFDADAWRRLA